MTARAARADALISESEFQRAVLELATLTGWRSAHFRAARTVSGWKTPCQGDARGFPDLLLLRGPELLAVELKSERGKTTPEQDTWLAAFRAAGIRAYLWRPSNWPQIVATLKRHDQ